MSLRNPSIVVTIIVYILVTNVMAYKQQTCIWKPIPNDAIFPTWYKCIKPVFYKRFTLNGQK